MNILGRFFIIKSKKTLQKKKGEFYMEFISELRKKEVMSWKEICTRNLVGEVVWVEGAIHKIRDMGEIAFLILRKKEGLFQCVWEKAKMEKEIGELREETVIRGRGKVALEERAVHGIEIRLEEIEILSEPAEPMPIPINKWSLQTSLETKLNLRPISLRNIKERAKFKIQEGIVRAFREFLYSQDFTEIRTPKITAKGAEGGSNIFKLDYFGTKAVLAQSPQFYKQTMVGVYDRVFETAPVFRAEKHNTTRHLNEYTSLDFEMGYIDSFIEIMEMETAFLKYMTAFLKEHYEEELKLLEVKLPIIEAIPQVRFDKAKELVAEKYQRKIRNPYDLEPEEEMLIGRYFKEEYQSDFVFITHYPSKKRPFYAMDDPQDDRFTLSFDLLFHGLEVTTGGQRIHKYSVLQEKIKKEGCQKRE